MNDPYKIKEIYSKVYHTILDFCDLDIFYDFTPKEGYIWFNNYCYGNHTWHEVALPIILGQAPISVVSRNARFDFIMDARRFLDVFPVFKSVHIFHIMELPPDSFDLGKIKGKARYQLLSKLGWTFEYEGRGNDYSEFVSNNCGLVQKVVDLAKAREAQN